MCGAGGICALLPSITRESSMLCVPVCPLSLAVSKGQAVAGVRSLTTAGVAEGGVIRSKRHWRIRPVCGQWTRRLSRSPSSPYCV
jgi:hypothetical protein